MTARLCKHVTIANVFSHNFNCIRFRRCLYKDTLVMWNELLVMCGQVVLTAEPHKVKWLLITSGSFLVKCLS